jgi:2-keto-4-pentenoate hydratase
MNEQTARQAAALLWQHRSAGTVLDALPAAMRPGTTMQGHAIQAQWPAVAGQRVVGWKIAATSVAGQKHINVGAPLAGRILAGFVLADGAAVSLAGNRMRVAEPEFAFRIARDLAPRSVPYTLAEVLDAVASLHPAFEVPDSRYAVFTSVGEAQLIALARPRPTAGAHSIWPRTACTPACPTTPACATRAAAKAAPRSAIRASR